MASSAWTQVFAAWRFSPSESRLAIALVRTGELRQSAAQIGISYETARELVASVMAKTGAKKQPEFVQQLVSLVFGDLPSNDTTWRTFADAFSLSNRQGRLAQLIAMGASRSAAAGILKISDQSAKGDLKIIFENCGVKRGAGLSRIVAEIDALARLASATQIEIQTEGAMTEPLRFIRRRRTPGRIALSDHGPADAKAVVVFHALFTGRHLPQVLVKALQAKGLRPISVERPGFGLTTPSDGDIFEDTNADLIDVLDALEIDRISILGRCSAFPLDFAAAHPERFDHGVLLRSKLAPVASPRGGLYGSASRLVENHPHLVRVLIQMMINNSSAQAVVKLVGRTIGNCPSDVTAFADTRNRRDFVRSARQISTPAGIVREYAVQVNGVDVPRGARDLSWTLVVGEQDGLAEGSLDGMAAWKEALPRARVITIPEGGRFIHMSHPEIVAAAFTL